MQVACNLKGWIWGIFKAGIALIVVVCCMYKVYTHAIQYNIIISALTCGSCAPLFIFLTLYAEILLTLKLFELT